MLRVCSVGIGRCIRIRRGHPGGFFRNRLPVPPTARSRRPASVPLSGCCHGSSAPAGFHPAGEIMPFSALGLPAPVTRGVKAAGYSEPTPIQREAIPLILPGHDLVASAQTGSGKTAAFLLPILARLLTGHRALRALVLVPTRELAAQVEANGRAYARFAQVSVGAVFGGVPIGPQEKMLRRDGVDLLVATPGRLLDLHGRQSVSLEDVEVLVLDEADRMVDMGFAPDLRRILKLLPERRQTLMFSATMPPELNRVANEALRHPKRLALAPPQRPAERIDQAFYPVPRALKIDLLDRILSYGDLTSAIVFVRTKRAADRVGRQSSDAIITWASCTATARKGSVSA